MSSFVNQAVGNDEALVDGTAACAGSDPSAEVGAGKALFQGDCGQLPYDTRRALNQLLRGPAMDAKRHAKLWPVLLRDESVVRSRLHELFLELVVDRDLQVAFTRQVQADSLDVPILLRTASLTFLESALALHLRQRLSTLDAQVERATTSVDEITGYMMIYERVGNVDRSGFSAKVQSAIEKAKKLGWLTSLGSDRFEVSPILKLLFSYDQVKQLMEAYRRILDAPNIHSLDGSGAVKDGGEGAEQS